MLKQVRFIIVSLLALLGAGTNQAFADGTLVDGLYYYLDNAKLTATVTYPGPNAPASASDNSYTGAVVVPSTVYYDGYEYNVTKIGDQAFRYSTVTSLTLNEGLVSTGTSALNNMTELTELTFPNSFTTIGGGDPLSGCSKLTKITFGSGIQNIAQGFCFSDTPLTDIYFLTTTPPTVGGYFMAGCQTAKIHVYDIASAAFAKKWPTIGWGVAPVIEADLIKPMTWEEFQNTLAIYESYNIKGGTAPGVFPEATAKPYADALAAANALAESATSDEMKAACKAIETEYNTLKTAAVNPLVEGYYYIVSNYEAYKEKYGVYPAMYTAPDFKSTSGASMCLYDKFDEKNANYIYKLTAKEGKDGYFYAQNMGTNWYLNTGDGDNWYNENTTCSEAATNAQWFRPYGVGTGAYWIADETDSKVGRAIKGTGNTPQRNLIFGWTQFTDTPSASETGYNTWSLIPVPADSVTKFVAAAAEEKTAKAQTLTELEPLVSSLASLAEAVVAKQDPYDKVAEATTEAFTKAYNNGKTLVTIKAYNETTPAATYAAVLQNLKTAKENLDNATPAVIEDGYYYIVNASPTFQQKQSKDAAMYVEQAGVSVKWGMFDRTDEKFVLELKRLESGNYSIKGYSTGAYVGTPQSNTYSIPVYASDTIVQQVITHYNKYAEGSYTIHSTTNSWDWHPLGNRSGAGTGDALVGWPAYLSDASTWNIQKVTDADWDAINQAKITEELKQAVSEGLAASSDAFAPHPVGDNLIKSDASNLSTNASSLNLATLVNGNLNDRTETWANYPAGEAYLQVEFTKDESGNYPNDLLLSIAPRNDSYYKSDTPKSWIITGSNDGENWKFVCEYATNPDSIAIGKLYTYPGILDEAYRYLRFTSPVAIENRTNVKAHFALSEFQLHEGYADLANYETAVTDSILKYTAYVSIMRQKINTNNGTAEDVAALKAATEAFKAFMEEAKTPVPVNYYEIAATPSAPEVGKTYVIKSVANGLYASTKGAVKTISALNSDAMWTIEQAEGQDGDDISLNALDPIANYVLKSVAKDGYWQVDDFTAGAQEGSPLDGYDVHKYAGLNASFGSKDKAQAFTILPATAYAAEETSSSIGNGKTPTGYVIATAEKITSGTFSKYYKLDTQGGDVALDSYLADVDWQFYEAVKGEDITKELDIAKAEYNFDTNSAATGTDPGYYDADNFAEYIEAVNAVNDLTGVSTKAQYRAAIDALAEAYAKVTVVNPIVEGYYTIVSAGKGSGYPFKDGEVMYDDEDKYAMYNKEGIVSWKIYDESLYDEIYYLSSDGNGNWFVKSLVDNSYIDKGQSSYNCKVSTSIDAATAQTFNPSVVAGKFAINNPVGKYAYALSPSHNGSRGNNSGTLNIWGSVSEANQGKMNLWYLHKVSDETVEAAKESIAASLNSLIAEAEGTDLEGSDRPGYYVQSNIDKLAADLAAAKTVTEGTISEKIEAYNKLKASLAKATTELNPITEGYYYIVNKSEAYKANFSVPAAMYVAPANVLASGFATVRFESFDENNAHFIFKLFKKDGVENGFYAYNEYNEMYLNTGDGATWYGETTNASDTPINAQLFRNYGVGQYWVADETDTRVSRSLRRQDTKNGIVYGWTQFSDNITADKTGYNAWELIPLTADQAKSLMEAQLQKDTEAHNQYVALNTYAESIKATYDNYVSDDSELNDQLKEALKNTYGAYTSLKSSYVYDITTAPEEYNAVKQSLEELMETARLELSGINGIAGGNGTVNAVNGGINVTADHDMTLTIVSASGAVVAKQSLKAGGTYTVSLTPGIYVANGKKVMVR